EAGRRGGRGYGPLPAVGKTGRPRVDAKPSETASKDPVQKPARVPHAGRHAGMRLRHDDAVGQFVVVQNRAAARRAPDEAEAAAPELMKVDFVLRLLEIADGQRGRLP